MTKHLLALIMTALVVHPLPARAARTPWVRLSAAAARAIALREVPVRTRVLRERRTLYGHFVLPPGAEAVVTPRIRGRVTALYATIGEHVRRGAPLARIESLLVGTPPPSVVVHAPLSGVVEARPALLGEAVAPGTLLYRLIDPKTLWLKAFVYQKDIALIHHGRRVRIRALGLSRPLTGRVTLIAPGINPRRGSETVWIRLVGPKAPVKPRLFARARVTVARARALSVPQGAVLRVNGRRAVFVSAGHGRFRYTPVVTGIHARGFVAVSGLARGSRVVTQGNAELFAIWTAGGRLRAGG